MPHEFNNQWVVTPDEIMPWYGTLDNLRQHIVRHKSKPTGIKKVQSGGNGRQMLISFDSLPNEIINSLGDPRKLHHQLEAHFKIDGEAVRFFQNYQFEDGGYLKISHQEQYITNASVLKALLLMKQRRIHERSVRRVSLKGLTLSLLNDATTFNPTLKAKYNCEHTLPGSLKRFKPALNDFEKSGYESLISKKHKNTNSRKVNDETISLLNSLFATQQNKPTRTEVARQYDAFLAGYIPVIDNSTGALFEPTDFKPLSEASIIAWLGKWEYKIGTYAARTGNRQKLIGQFVPSHKFHQPKFAGSIISIDDRQPPFKYDKDNSRMWWYMAIDLASGAFISWVYGKSKEGIILPFYRQLVRDHHERGLNMPGELEAEMSLNSSFVNTFLRPGNMFEHVHIEANKARAKRIERYFGQLRYDPNFEKSRSGWVARPHAISEANQVNEDKAPIVPCEVIIQNCLKDIQIWNNMPHNKQAEMSKMDYYLKNQNPNLKPTNWMGILPHIGHKTSTSCNAGIIRLNNETFLLGDKGVLHTGESLINMMKLVEGEKIDIYWLDGNDGEVIKALIYIGGQYIGEAIEQPIYHRAKMEQTTEDKANRERMSAYTNTITAYMSAQKRSLEKVVLIDNRVMTVNDNFKIRGLNENIMTPADQVQVLPDAPESYDFPIEPTYSPSLLNRF